MGIVKILPLKCMSVQRALITRKKKKKGRVALYKNREVGAKCEYRSNRSTDTRLERESSNETRGEKQDRV